jgi:hypothetical protein
VATRAEETGAEGATRAEATQAVAEATGSSLVVGGW